MISGGTLVEALHVLLVEDNPGDARLIRESLRAGGRVELEVAGRLGEALEKLEENRFDAVLLDLSLPDSQGLGTLAAVLARTRSPVLVLTGLNDESVGIQAVRQGAEDFLIKGQADDELLRRALRYAVERSRLRAALAAPLLDAAPVGLAVLGRDLRYLYVNSAFAALNGLAPEGHLGREVGAIAPAESGEMRGLLAEVVETGRAILAREVPGRSQLAGDEPGTWLVSCEPLRDAQGLVVAVSVSAVDITERTRREAVLSALAESRTQAQVIGESIPFGIWLAGREGGMRYLSESFLEAIGMGLEEASGFGWMRALVSDDLAPTRQAWSDCIERGDRWEWEYRLAAGDGQVKTVLSRGFPVRDEAGEVTSWAGINLEISARKEAEAFRDALIGVLSHELRTPVTAIYGASTLLGRSGIDRELRDELLADIGEEADRLRRLVEDLLVLAKAEHGANVAIDEPVILRHVLPPLVAGEGRRWPGRQFELTMADHLPLALGEEAMVEQVLRNLLSNAAKYGGVEGTVEVVADAPGGVPRIRVLDRGPGVDPNEADRLFQLLYRSPRTARTASGSGIGLFVARRLVESMGGRIWGRPRDDGPGAEFGFSLRPLVDEAE